MNTQCIKKCATAALAVLALSPFATSQTVVTTTEDRPAVVSTTTTRVGRIGTVTPDTLVMDSAAGTEPVRYYRSTKTVYVDDTGTVVPADTITAGVPVTVHYMRDADRMVADRVIVHRKTVVPEGTVVERPAGTVVERPAGAVVEKKTTTTTTTTQPVKVRKHDDDDKD